MSTLKERFMAKFTPNPETGCWSWTAYLCPEGYGKINAGGRGGRALQAHRVSFELFVGEIPDGLTIDHVCHSYDLTCAGGKDCQHRRCVNPDHLEPVTQGENTMRGRTFAAARAAQTHCIRGHEFTPENTDVAANGNRRCRTCIRDHHRDSARVRRAAHVLEHGSSANADKTHCPLGHPYDEENTFVKSNGWRDCRTCKNDRQNARYRTHRNPNPKPVPADRTHCPAGHEYNAENTRFGAKGNRLCRACHRARVSASYHARKAAASA